MRFLLPSLTICALLGNAYAQDSGLPATPPNMPAVSLPATPPAAAPVAAPAPAPSLVRAPAAPAPAPTATASPTPVPASPTPVLPATPEGTPVAPGPGEVMPGDASAPLEPANKDGIPGFSFGDVNASLMFTTRQIETMKTVLQAAESSHPGGPATPTVAVPDDILPFAIAPKSIAEPTSYPVFYLSSVAYHTVDDWTVWLDQKRITPKTNHGEIEVSAISPDMVTFVWKPPYLQALVKRQEEGKFASLKNVKHRLTAASNVVFDESKGLVSFSLRPNQSFAVGYMNTFEGKVNSPALPSIQVQPAFGGDTKDAKPEAAGKPTDASAKAVLNDLGGGGMSEGPPPSDNIVEPPPPNDTLNALKTMVKKAPEGFSVAPHPPSGPPETAPPRNPAMQ